MLHARMLATHPLACPGRADAPSMPPYMQNGTGHVGGGKGETRHYADTSDTSALCHAYNTHCRELSYT